VPWATSVRPCTNVSRRRRGPVKLTSVDAETYCTTASTSSDVARVTTYYDARAPEYDDTTYELARRFPAYAAELVQLEAFVGGLPPGRVLDVGCGTGWLTHALRGPVIALDASAAMLQQARARLGEGVYVLATVPPLPFLERSFDFVFASNFYSHLPDQDLRRSFVSEAFRVAGELVVVEQAWNADLPRESWEKRRLRDGTSYPVYKRFLTSVELAEELGGEVALETPSWVGVRAPAD
jgi:ubiquinone/menaquinone biosynthesis C-methylase UbiE